MGEGIDKVEVEYRIPEGLIVKDERFLIQVLKDMNVLLVFIHRILFAMERYINS